MSERPRSGFLIPGVLALLATLCLPQHAIIIRHDRADARYIELGRRFLPALCRINLPDGEGTLIAPSWVLTAGHVALDIPPGHEVLISGKKYRITGRFVHPDYVRSRHDVALLRLHKPVRHVRPVELYRERDEVGRIVTLVGGGESGTGLTGPRLNDGIVRAALNRIDQVNKAWIIFNFDPPETALDMEGISGPGDSGGPAFIRKDGMLYLAGVSAIQSFLRPGDREGRYGVLEYYSRVSSYADWIDGILKKNSRHLIGF